MIWIHSSSSSQPLLFLFQRQPCCSKVSALHPASPLPQQHDYHVPLQASLWSVGRGRHRRRPPWVVCSFEIKAAVYFTARRQRHRKMPRTRKGWWWTPDAAPSAGVLLPPPHTGNAPLPAQRSFILMAETFIVPKELVPYNSPLCAADSSMSHMQSQGKAWILRRALHDPSAQRYIQLEQCYFCLMFWWLLGTCRWRHRQLKCAQAPWTFYVFSLTNMERGGEKSQRVPDVPNCPAAAESELAVSVSTCTSWFFTSPYVCSDTCNSAEQATWQPGHFMRTVHAVLKE